VFGVQCGVQFERTPEQLSSHTPNEHGRDPPSATPTLGLGAGRSQVQILSPRSKENPANELFSRRRLSRRDAFWGTIGEQFFSELANGRPRRRLRACRGGLSRR
jgi:hypothetical protein